jgi:hypothetical protein
LKKSKKIFLGVAGVVALFGICFLCLSFYAKNEINSPKFELPELASEQPASPLPKSKEDAFDYVSRLFNECTGADDIELGQHTDIHMTEGDMVTPFSDADNSILPRVLESMQGAMSAMYPTTENTLMTKAENIPVLGFTKKDVTDFEAVKGYVDEYGETIDDGNYYITLTVDPSAIDTKAMLDSEVRKSVEKELSPMLSVASLDITPDAFTASFRISYTDDTLCWVELKSNVILKAGVDFTENYKALSDKTAELEIPYEKVRSIDFFHYGLNFTERQMAVQKNDMKALPLDVRVNSETTKADYKLSFDVSDDGILEIDADGVMSVVGTQEKPVTVTAKLEYDGHTYTDTLTVYATELEVKIDEPEYN